MLWEDYFTMKENAAQPLFQGQERQSRRDLYSTLVDTKDSLEALQGLLEGEVEQLLSKMNTALAATASDDPFYRTVTKTQQYIAKMKTDMKTSVERLMRGIERDLTNAGMTLNRKNLTRNPQDDQKVGHEDFEDAGRAHLGGFQQIPPDARRI